MRGSDDAGHNLCEWFFYNSLAEGMKRRKPRNVAFIHVPPGKSGPDLKAGVELWQSFVSALADQIQAPGLPQWMADDRGQQPWTMKQAMGELP
jgi:hypothetical protein